MTVVSLECGGVNGHRSSITFVHSTKALNSLALNSFTGIKLSHKLGSFRISNRYNSSLLLSTPLGYDDESLQRILADAKKLVEDTKVKIESEDKSKETEERLSDTSQISENMQSTIPKSAEERRLYLLDGVSPDSNGKVRPSAKLMEQLAEEEDWELRLIEEMFEDQIPQPSEMDKRLQKKDIGRSLMMLRRQLQDDDFRKVFNSRNPRIGES
eukprot:CAMPEP_0113304776 /NCGR_PEP_ID=MMETSP0010_2-20120614/4652_1 /TAXON_ID=216773 ORGANISM="Corethron hystrix, Strain 308" /NCGR_SAMPLE_ID=MMETSP0010_2 /ASSEMBLY_ACC=CAM_ASM_000155 /LENGTH=212 /DNA_ID=CAMNT_0000159031 /DNA_START=118 /DNA_END=756 /DNA_ORIENTATION=+ /assembly_acc=CAM_ASM_000155